MYRSPFLDPLCQPSGLEDSVLMMFTSLGVSHRVIPAVLLSCSKKALPCGPFKVEGPLKNLLSPLFQNSHSFIFLKI